MKEMDKQHRWFRPMIEAIGQRLLATVSWGLKFRMYAGAGLSWFDLASDLNAVSVYINQEDATKSFSGRLSASPYAKNLLIMIAVNMVLQLLVVVIQNQGGKKRDFLKEALVTLLFMKPGLDAMRVAGGEVKPPHSPLDYDIELAMTKGCEVLAESIPG